MRGEPSMYFFIQCEARSTLVQCLSYSKEILYGVAFIFQGVDSFVRYSLSPL